jgi:hypothetical protein
MSQANPFRLFITHAWESSDDYLRVFEYLESAKNFFYLNFSTPDKPPGADKEAQREDLRRQIAPTEAVIALASLYDTHKDLLTFQLREAGDPEGDRGPGNRGDRVGRACAGGCDPRTRAP